AEAAGVMSEQPAALQLRLLQTVVAVAAEKNSTLVLPFPVELLRFLERAQVQPGAPTVEQIPTRPRPDEHKDDEFVLDEPKGDKFSREEAEDEFPLDNPGASPLLGPD
ncbi:slipin family protein, partial [Streptomyces mirabilis]